jgi:hypothetical protein
LVSDGALIAIGKVLNFIKIKISIGKIIFIVSWGVPCGKGLPDVYTRVAAFKDWIDLVIDFPAFPEYEEDPEI